jgi:hypothetical protein
MLRKINGEDLGDDTRLDDGVSRASMVGMPAPENQFRTTEGDECSYEEATNCRLREETNASMMFGLGQNSAVVRLNQI